MKFGMVCIVLLLTAVSAGQGYAQRDTTRRPNSPVFRNYQPPTTAPLLEQSDVTYQMWQGFRVMQQANAGDPVSQFELSVRYLTGRGFRPDTAKAAYWAKKAADQNHLLARYNYGIFEFNGWGTAWNPFDAYKDFRFLAERNIPEAQYVLAQFLTENLVLPRNVDEAYRWVKLAADSGYAPAKETLKEFQRRGYRPPDSSGGKSSEQGKAVSPSTQAGAIQVQLLNFSPDTTKAPSDTVLFEDAVKAAMLSKDEQIQRIFSTRNSSVEQFALDSTAFSLLLQSARAGSPEALTLVGWCYERGVRVPKDVILAAAYYIRGIRLDSPRASRLLFDLLQSRDFFKQLRERVDRRDPDALYVWPCLVAFGFDRQLTDAQALQMLERAAAEDHQAAIIELGLCYYSGRWTPRDEKKAGELWRRAKEMGSSEAAIRLAIMKIRTPQQDYSTPLAVLKHSADSGSVLAEVALGYCFEQGIGVDKNPGEAARLYRNSVQRGSQDAFRALMRMHDAIRPHDKEFQIPG